ncbi:30S ribosomal protein S16 [candidate division WWE3 bacterium]|jgi:small subunit ribosomal protein S16|uniref:Small ribosomal subunit protein bS16 n=1 Tax=candidate division WWE3 bacterium TaxID=2053526 RepID=A0A3A4ZDW1_UNCKA|nr:MAG: 30S ribosomal protein S16 [candidate division WWE3 bacterium]
MSITIRLARIGRKNSPAYKVVVANTRSKRNGRFLDILGHYNPSETPVALEIDKKRLEDWRSKGALITDSVTNLLEGNYSYTPYRSKKATAQKKDDQEIESSE